MHPDAWLRGGYSMRRRMAASIVEHLAQRLNWVATPVVIPTAGNT
jgi:hypothetical protein